jgi:hypothetical protein
MILRFAASVGVALALSVGPSFAQSHPSPETIKLFDADALGYPGLVAEHVQQMVGLMATTAAVPTAANDFPPMDPSSFTTQAQLDAWTSLLEQEKQGLQDAEARGLEDVADRYREDIAMAQAKIDSLQAALAAHQAAPGTENASDQSPSPANPIPPDDNSTPPSASPTPPSGPTIGDLMNTPEAQAKLASARQAATDALKTAGNGQYSDAQKIMNLLVQVLGASRQLSLAGMDDEAGELEGKAKDTLIVFSDAFANKCSEQSFDNTFVLGLTRQDQLLDHSGENLQPCLNRLLTTGSVQGWRQCGIGTGNWLYKDNRMIGPGKVSGTGQAPGRFTIHTTNPTLGVDYTLEGRLEFKRDEQRTPDGKLLGVTFTLTEYRDSVSGHYELGSQVRIQDFSPEAPSNVEILNNNKPCNPALDPWIQ